VDFDLEAFVAPPQAAPAPEPEATAADGQMASPVTSVGQEIDPVPTPGAGDFMGPQMTPDQLEELNDRQAAHDELQSNFKIVGRASRASAAAIKLRKRSSTRSPRRIATFAAARPTSMFRTPKALPKASLCRRGMTHG
jgi:hypothetical protein